jgi:hypothetical protein
LRSSHAISYANGAPPGDTCRMRLPVPVGNPALGQVIWGQFQRDSVAIHDLDAISPKPSGHGREDGFADVELDGEHSSSELLDHLA